MAEEEVVKVFVPALVALLTRAEEIAERPLHKEEVLRIRDTATVVEYPLAATPSFLKQRGYHDLYEPECWEEWQLYQEGRLDLSIEQDENT